MDWKQGVAAANKKAQDAMYKYVDRPLFKAGEKLAKENKGQAITRHKADAERIDSGKALTKDSTVVKRRIKELESEK